MSVIYDMKKWEEDKEFSANVGQFVTPDIVSQMRDCVPPVTNLPWMMQCGEPYSHDMVTGAALYSTFIRKNDHWMFVGHHPAFDTKTRKFSAPQSLVLLKMGCDMRDDEYPDAELRNHRYYCVTVNERYGALLWEICQWNKPIDIKGKLKYTKESYMYANCSHEVVSKNDWIECYGLNVLPGTCAGEELPDRLGFEPRYTKADVLRAVNKLSVNQFNCIVESNDRDCLGMGW